MRRCLVRFRLALLLVDSAGKTAYSTEGESVPNECTRLFRNETQCLQNPMDLGGVGPGRLFMKFLCLLSLLLVGTVAAQTAVAEKPCVSFVPESTSPTNTYAKGPLQGAVMLSGDFEF